MSQCDLYDPDKVFRRFKLIDFPISFVGLSTSQELNVEMDLTSSSYLKTMYRGNLLKFDDARELSASHRAFTIAPIDKQTVQITFKPINECISRVMRTTKMFGNRFVFDLRLIKVDGLRCCDDEYHSEVGRYYITGEYEQCNITHSPDMVDFGKVLIKSKVSRTIRIRNQSNFVSAKMYYIKSTDFEVCPPIFIVSPNSSKRVTITLRPNRLTAVSNLVFHIRNPHDPYNEGTTKVTAATDNNYLSYNVAVQVNIYCSDKVKEILVESMHTLYEPQSHNAYLGKQLTVHNERKEIANQFLKLATSQHVKKKNIEKLCTGTVRCFSYTSLAKEPRKTGLNFCKEYRTKAKASDLFSIRFVPLVVDFGMVGVETFGEKKLSINNNTDYDIVVRFLEDACVLYTQNKLACYTIKLKSRKAITITILCLGHNLGKLEGTFEYVVDNKFICKHRYVLEVASPSLRVMETLLKFGMITSEGFVSSVPVRIYNNFNVPVDYEWADVNVEVPFEVLPQKGTIPELGCRICDVIYTNKLTKAKVHEVTLLSKGESIKHIPLEINILTRKLSVKFLQTQVIFKDVPLNLESIQKLKLENTSREIALFYVVEPLLPGITIEPMSGTLRPKTIINFVISVKIPCVLEFNFDVFVKVNNKESIGVLLTGNTIEPKLNIFPKNIYIPRIPCGLITYVPVTLQNTGPVKTDVEVLDTGDENIFNIYAPFGNEKQRIFKFSVEGGQSKIVFIKVCDIFRREYEMYIPFKINGLLGPPNHDAGSTELQYYINQFEKDYGSTLKAKVKSINKDISYCRIGGVITVPWIQFSVERFEIDYVPNRENSIEFSMTNISKYYLYVTIMTSKLSPHFSLKLLELDSEFTVTENIIKFELDLRKEATFCVDFHPKGLGRYAAIALFYLDKAMSIPYSNLTFIGKYQCPAMTASTYRIIFPPCHAGTQLSRIVTLTYHDEGVLEGFTCSSKEESHINVEFLECRPFEDEGNIHTQITVKILVSSLTSYSRNMTLIFHYELGSCCQLEINFCFTFCPLTLHSYALVTPDETPYPYYPQSDQTKLYEYMETCKSFLERWMFQQGFRRDLYPEIPDTFHAISSAMASTPGKTKGLGMSYLNFMRRIAGPLMKHIHKVAIFSVEEPLKSIKETHDTYNQIIRLLRSRGANLWHLQAKFLLTHDQFVLLSQFEPPKFNAEIYYTEELTHDIELFNRLTKQSWMDLIIQSYKVFVLDSCFFECICVSSQPRDIVQVLVNWYNEQILIARYKLFEKDKPAMTIDNITSDLKDGVAITSALINHCPFLEEHFRLLCKGDTHDAEPDIIVHNACLVIEALNILRLYFPLTSKDMLKPNFLQMLFLSIHLYVTLPMYKVKSVIEFTPPLLRSSTRQVTIVPMSQESLMFNYVIFNNSKNCFHVEKAPAGENGKKVHVSVKYFANFVGKQTAILLVHGYNKTRIFDTYVIFNLIGSVGALNPLRKCKLTAPLYRPNRVDVMVYSPFGTTVPFTVNITDNEPTIPVDFEITKKKGFHIKRLNLMEQEITLTGLPKDSSDISEHKLYLQMTCLSSQTGTSWIWFRSDIGEFFIKVVTQPRSDYPLETMQVNVDKWPMDPCSCGEACECYRSAILMIPHRNDLMLKALRFALLEHASDTMMNIYDSLIDSTTGQIILSMLLAEGGTNLMEVKHILRPENTYRITSKTLMPRLDSVTLKQHSDAVLALPVTLPPYQKSEKFSITFTSDSGVDIRTYKILFFEMRGDESGT